MSIKRKVYNPCIECDSDSCFNCALGAYRTLGTFEDLSKLVKAVSLIGKDVYSNAPFADGKVRDDGVVQVEIDRNGIEIAVDSSPEPLCGYFKTDDSGKTVFLTSAEAEAALAMKP